MLKSVSQLSRGRAWFAAGAPILALVLVAMGLALALVWGFAREHDRTFEDTSSRLVESAWRAREHASARVALDYAVWNDAYLATTADWNEGWVQNNYYSNVADGVLVLRTDGDVRHAWIADGFEGQHDAIIAGVVDAVEHDLNLGALLSAQSKDEMTATTLYEVGGNPVILSIAPISPEEQAVRQARDPELPVDYLVAIDVVTRTELGAMGQSIEAGGLRFQPAPSARSSEATIAMTLADVSERTVGGLTWARQRPGSAALLGKVGLIVGFLFIIGALALVIARKLVGDQLRAAAEVNGAQEASRVKSEFISTMSHELRTPLNAIMGYAELIKEEAEDGASPEVINTDADRILTAAKHLAQLINDVLDQSRIDAGKISVTPESVVVAAALEGLKQLMLPLAQANGNTLVITCEAEATLVHADPMRLQQCLINLTGNALKFTREGEVSVRARRLLDHQGAYISFEIADTGIGMEKSELDRLFKPFAQANARVSAKYGGTGLGLSITRSLARAMGGDVDAQSALGKGSVFTLRLPAARVQPEAPFKPRLVAA
jgi:signal transduction histidine kinase